MQQVVVVHEAHEFPACRRDACVRCAAYALRGRVPDDAGPRILSGEFQRLQRRGAGGSVIHKYQLEAGI